MNIEMLENMISIFSLEKRVKMCKNLCGDSTASERIVKWLSVMKI